MITYRFCWFCGYRMHKEYQYWVNIKKLVPVDKKSVNVKVCMFCKDQIKFALSKNLKYENPSAGSGFYCHVPYINF